MSETPTQGDDLSRFLDTASGIPLTGTARGALASAWAVAWPDPGRRYPGARRSRDLLEQSRASVAASLGLPPDGVVFAESPERAVWLAVTGHLDERRQLLVSAVEDLAVWRTGDVLQRGGAQVGTVPVDRQGTVDVDWLARAAGQHPSVAVVQASSLEIGTRQPLREIRAALPPDTPLVVDARGVIGREPLDDAWDVVIADPRMWGGPPGPAVIGVRAPGHFSPAAVRTDGALGIESTVPPVPLIAAGALALEEARAGGPWQVAAAVDHLRDTVASRIRDVQVLGDPTRRVGYLAMFSFLYVPADELVDDLGRRGWAVASGASCTSDTRRPHHVLVAIGALTHGSLRVSAGPWTTAATLAQFANDLEEAVAAIRSDVGAGGL